MVDINFVCIGDQIMVINNLAGDNLMYEWIQISGLGMFNFIFFFGEEFIIDLSDVILGSYIYLVVIGNEICGIII